MKSRARSRYLTQDEEVQLLCHLAPKYHDVVCFILDTGARVREVLRLSWADLQHHPALDRVTFWKTKTRRPRTVPLTARAHDCLVRAKAEGRHRPFPHTYAALYKAFTLAKERAGLDSREQEPLVIHSLRHTAASRLVQRGARLEKVQAFLGHSSIDQTMRYSHLAPDALDGLADLLEQPA